MSINSALISATSGLLAQSSAIAGISDNIANVNTVGFRRNLTDFTALVQLQDASTTFNAGGVQAETRQAVSQQGTLQATASSTDLAIAGDGFFVVSATADPLQADSEVAFTRAGSFLPNADGFLQNTAGFFLQAIPIPADGSVVVNPGDLTQLQPINIAGIAGAAEATSSITFNANLSAAIQPSAAAATFNSLTNNLSSGAITPDFQRSVQFFDSLGGQRTLTLSFLRTDPTLPGNAANEFIAEATIEPAGDIVTGAGLDGASGQIASGRVRFTSTGAFDPVNSTFPLTLGFLDSANTAPLGPNDVQFAAATGVAGQSITLNFGGDGIARGLTQFDTDSTLISTQVDGAVFGALAGIEVSPSGEVIAQFANGITSTIAQIPLATFVNPDGLTAGPGGVFLTSPDSGPFNIQIAGTGAVGQIAGSTLEASNVDLASEFSGLIITQQAYTASARIISTADELLDELLQLAL